MAQTSDVAIVNFLAKRNVHLFFFPLSQEKEGGVFFFG